MARQLRSNYGYSYEDSLFIAGKCINDYQRCGICGLPGWFNKVIHRKGGPFLRGNERVNRRLVPDHIISGGPSTLENTRILCFGCNYIRGAGRYTDVEILRTAKRWYEYMFPQKFLFWLHQVPGEGGNLFKSKHMEAKELKTLGQAGFEKLVSLKIQIGDMQSDSPDPIQIGEMRAKFL